MSKDKDNSERLIWLLLGLLDGTRGVAQVVAEMARGVPDLDRTSIRTAIDDLAVAASLVAVAPMAMTGLFVPGATPCYRCYQATVAGSCADQDGKHGLPLLPPTGNAAICPTANLGGHLTGLEAVRFLTGLRPRSLGRILYLNLIKYEAAEVVPQLWQACPSCGPHPDGALAIHTGRLENAR
jgi:hypothetical protein